MIRALQYLSAILLNIFFIYLSLHCFRLRSGMHAFSIYICYEIIENIQWTGDFNAFYSVLWAKIECLNFTGPFFLIE